MCVRLAARPGLVASAVALCFSPLGAFANPSGATLAAGGATFVSTGRTLTVTNTPGAIINWQQFSIAKDEVTRFIQQNAASAVLNRVIGQDPSVILGQLHSNGRVFLINPSGIAFGQGAVINVASFAASTLNISDGDFISGRLRFAGSGSEGKISNAGEIRTPQGGHVYLVAPKVENQASGVINAPNGEVIIAAGRTVELVHAQTPDIRVEFTAPDNEAVNAGQIVASSGRIGVYGTLIKNSGLVSASRAEVGRGGKIVFRATSETLVQAGSRLEATGDRGGEIQVLGNRVAVLDGASLDASGDHAGGTVLVGGDFQGRNPDVQNAQRTYFGAGASIAADALLDGDGGKVIVWSDEITRAYGSISARGGAASGDGGLVEVSGKALLDFSARVNVGAASGNAGTVLLDPLNLTVVDAGGTDNAQVAAGTDESILFADGGAGSFTLSDETLEALTGNVVLQATNDILVSAGLSGGLAFTNQTSGERVVLQAGRHVTVSSPLSTAGAALWLEADSPHQPGSVDGVGLVEIKAGAPVTTNGGAVTLIGGAASNPQGGFKIDADVNAGAGGINVGLSQATGDLDFFVGAGGNTQLTSSDTGSLKTTGALVLGRATTAGSDGLGTGAQTVTVNSLTNATANPIQLSSESGSSFQLYAGGGGIDLSRPLTTFQDTVISTTGPLAINETLATSGNDLTIVASSVTLGANGSINVGDGIFSCTGAGCTALTGIFWDGGGGNLNWFDPLNWSNNVLPTASDDVTIETAAGTITVSGGGAAAKSLVSLFPVTIDTGGSLDLVNASTFSGTLAITGGSLLGTGIVSVSGPNGALAWSGGTIGAGGNMVLSPARPATFSNSLVLNRLFQNDGMLTLSGATLGGSGSIVNNGTLTATGTNTVAKLGLGLLGSVGGAGSLTVNDWSRLGGTFSMAGSAHLKAASGNFTVDHVYSAGNITLQAPVDVILTANASVNGTGASGTTVTLVAGGNFTNNNAGAGVLSSGTGRWLVYSSSPGADTRGALTYNFKQYNATYGATTVADAGSGFLYTLAPVITPSLISTVSKVYDGNTTATLAGGNYALTGAVDGDTVVLSNPTSGLFADANASTGKTVSVSGISIASATNGSATIYGYQLGSTSASANIGTIDPRAITLAAVTGSKTYGNADPALSVTVSGGSLAGGDLLGEVSGTVGRQAGETVAGGPYDILIGTGLKAGNYAISFNADNNAFTIDPRAISLLGARAYDGTTTIAATVFGAIGGINGETVVASGAGTVASKDVVAGTQALTLGTLALTDGGNGGLASNYTLVGGTHTATILPATLYYLASAASRPAGEANPAFDGTVTGFVAGETLATATSGSLVWSGSATSSSPAGQYAITGDGLSAPGGNYALVQAAGNATALTVTQVSSIEQLIHPIIEQINTSPAVVNLQTGTTQTPTSTSSQLQVPSSYLETSTGIVPLDVVTEIPSGMYVNIVSGEPVLLTGTILPPPGTYLNQDTKTVVSVVEEDGTLVLLQGAVRTFQTGETAVVRRKEKAPVCK